MHDIDHNAGDEWALVTCGVCDGCGRCRRRVSQDGVPAPPQPVGCDCLPPETARLSAGGHPSHDISPVRSQTVSYGFSAFGKAEQTHLSSPSSPPPSFSSADLMATLQHGRSSEGGAWAPRALQSVVDEVALQLAWPEVVSDAVSYREYLFSFRRSLLAEL